MKSSLKFKTVIFAFLLFVAVLFVLPTNIFHKMGTGSPLFAEKWCQKFKNIDWQSLTLLWTVDKEYQINLNNGNVPEQLRDTMGIPRSANLAVKIEINDKEWEIKEIDEHFEIEYIVIKNGDQGILNIHAGKNVSFALERPIYQRRFPDGKWIIGVCKDSHAFEDGGTIVVKDSQGKIYCFLGHVCGFNFLRSIFKSSTDLESVYKKLSHFKLYIPQK